MRPNVVHFFSHFMRADLADSLAPSWFMCVGIAGVVGLVLMLALAKRRGIDSGIVASVVLWSYLAAVTAGIVVPMTIDAIGRLASTGQLAFRWAGMTSFWGYLAGAIALVAVCRRDKFPVAKMADLAVIPMGAALVLSRLGCFMAGCDYGRVSSVPWAVRFPAGSPAWRDQIHAGLIPAGRLESLPVHPTQLYEAALGLAIIVLGIVFARKKGMKDGRAFVMAVAVYAIGRLLNETLRADMGRGVYAGLSSGQIFSLLVLFAIAAKHVFTKRAITVAAPLVILGMIGGRSVYADDGSAAPPPTSDLDLPPPTPAAPPPPPNTSAFEVPAPVPIVLPNGAVIPAGETRPLRPVFTFGILLAGATTVNRPGETIPDLSGATLSLGYVPGRFGLWLDFDRMSNSEAHHTSAVASVSFAPKVTPRLWLGVRAGLGITNVTFMSSDFDNVVAPTFRIDPQAEIVLGHNWSIWVRPLTIDVVSSDQLGGPITTVQFRAGLAYRLGERGALW
ncbi:MAG: prolipoprotein diacylglyceryl transferase [Kofleriaceae bacterium]